jgi:hypothetical protein
MRAIAKILVIWGVLLPLIALPTTATDVYGVIPLLQISLWSSVAHLGVMDIEFETILIGALLLIGFGLSSWVLASEQLESLEARRGGGSR